MSFYRKHTAQWTSRQTYHLNNSSESGALPRHQYHFAKTTKAAEFFMLLAFRVFHGCFRTYTQMPHRRLCAQHLKISDFFEDYILILSQMFERCHWVEKSTAGGINIEAVLCCHVHIWLVVHLRESCTYPKQNIPRVRNSWSVLSLECFLCLSGIHCHCSYKQKTLKSFA